MQGNEPTWNCSSDLYTMNQLCKVCGEPAAGFHFGAFTCEGCKSFFGRTYNNLSSLSECKNNGRCVINKKNRTSCKSCRLRKCLVVGMSKSGSRYGRRSNWFKIHCLLQDQAHMNGQLDSSMGMGMGNGNGELTPQLGYASKGEDEEEDCKDDLMLTGSPDSRSDYCAGDMDAKTSPSSGNGLYADSKTCKSGSLSPMSSYASPSPPYDKKENYNLHALPVSPMSPLTALHHQQKFFGHAAAAAAAAGFLHQNGYAGAFHHAHHHHRLATGAGSVGAGSAHLVMPGAPGVAEHSPLHAAFRPYHAGQLNHLDLLLKKRKGAYLIDVTPGACSAAPSTGGVGLQEVPMDLSVKKTTEVKEEEEDECRAPIKRENRDDDTAEGADAGKRNVESPLDLTKRS